MSRRDALIGCLARHVEAKAPHIGEEPPSPRGCTVLLALDVLCAVTALDLTQAEVTAALAPADPRCGWCCSPQHTTEDCVDRRRRAS